MRLENTCRACGRHYVEFVPDLEDFTPRTCTCGQEMDTVIVSQGAVR